MRTSSPDPDDGLRFGGGAPVGVEQTRRLSRAYLDGPARTGPARARVEPQRVVEVFYPFGHSAGEIGAPFGRNASPTTQ